MLLSPAPPTARRSAATVVCWLAVAPHAPPAGHATVALPGGPALRVESAHPAAPCSVGVVGGWRTDLAAKPRATPDGQLGILAGDFNATLDHSPLRALLGSGYVDAADAAGAGLVGT